jgi:hypothetical protein
MYQGQLTKTDGGGFVPGVAEVKSLSQMIVNAVQTRTIRATVQTHVYVMVI